MRFIASPAKYRCARGCSECCQLKLDINLVEAAEISERTGLPTYAFTDETSGLGSLSVKKKGGNCFFLEEGSCSIYDYRPTICRLYPLRMTTFFGSATETGEIMCNAEALEKGRRCCEHTGKELEERELSAEEVAGIAERSMKMQAAILKTLKAWEPGGNTQERLLKAYRQMGMEEAVGLLLEKYRDGYVLFNSTSLPEGR